MQFFIFYFNKNDWKSKWYRTKWILDSTVVEKWTSIIHGSGLHLILNYFKSQVRDTDFFLLKSK